MTTDTAIDEPRNRAAERAQEYREALGAGMGLLTVLYPAAPATLLISYLVTERRRVRQRWWASWWAVFTLLALISAGGPLALIHHGVGVLVAPWSGLIGGVLIDAGMLVGWNLQSTVAELQTWTISDIVVWHILIGTPLGLFITLVVNEFRNYARRELGRIEGNDYSNVRPVGILDRLRQRRTTRRIRSGAFSDGKPDGTGSNAIGTGRYGAPVLLDRTTQKRPMAVLGGPRSGKTRHGNSLGGQEIRAGSGGIIIDFKADPAIPQHYAEIAHEQRRHFLHFSLTDKATGDYRCPHPYAPPMPAYYDPLVRGNGASKAAMLLESVNREGDAAAYVRTAYEVVQMAYDVGAMTGFSHGRGGFDTLTRMLDMAHFQHQVDLLTPEMVQHAHPWMPMADVQRRVGLLNHRVEILNQQVKQNQVLRGAIGDTQSLVSTYQQSPAGGAQLRPGPAPMTIDLVRAVLRNEIIVFSLSTQDYPSFSRVLGTMVLLDLQNTVSTLRSARGLISRYTGESAATADATPWRPPWVQIEEFGSANSDAVLGLLNKSSDAGVRTLLSTQSWSDIVAVDGTGVFGRRVLDQIGNMFSFQLGERESDAVVADFSSTVTKISPVEDLDISKGNRFGFGKGANRARNARTASGDYPRVKYGATQHLEIDPDGTEMIWVAKYPQLRAVHTVPEGPNSWYEVIRHVPVRELPLRHDSFADPHAVATAQQHRDEQYQATAHELATDEMLAAVLDNSNEITDVEHGPTAGPEPAETGSTQPLGSIAAIPWGGSGNVIPRDTDAAELSRPDTEVASAAPAAAPELATASTSDDASSDHPAGDHQAVANLGRDTTTPGHDVADTSDLDF